MEKTLQCPNCNQMFKVEGEHGEQKSFKCPNCNSDGEYIFLKDSDGVDLELNKMKRPLGVTILAAIQLLSLFQFAVIVFLVPDMIENNYIITSDSIRNILLIISTVIMIPPRIIIASGLLNGINWARSSLILLQIFAVILGAIQLSVLPILVSIVIIIYLRKPHVLDFFSTKQPLRKSLKNIVIIGILIHFIVNVILSILYHPISLSFL